MISEELIRRLQEIQALTVCPDAPLKKLNGFAVGGNADLLLQAQTVKALREAVLCLHEASVPIHVLGNGSNLLVSDQGVRGAVIRIADNLGDIRIEGNRISCGAGLGLYQLSAAAARNGLSGAEFCCGIPGSVGGAIMMNAGAYESCMADIVIGVEYLEPDGSLRNLSNEELDFSYRHSRFSDHPGIVTGISMELEEAEPGDIYAKMAELQLKRRSSQPLEKHSCGSTFKRPVGHFAGKLISDAGLKGWRKGVCGVSELHAGFVINYGDASAREMYDFILEVREKVFQHSGVCLEPEVKLFGDWGGLTWN